MSEFNIEVQGGSSVRLPTAGKYCEQDIIVTAKGGNTGGTAELENLIDESGVLGTVDETATAKDKVEMVLLYADVARKQYEGRIREIVIMPPMDYSKTASLSGKFQAYSSLEVVMGEIDCSSTTTLTNLANSAEKIKSLTLRNTKNVSSWGNAFRNCLVLETISELDCSSSTGFSQTFQACHALRNIDFVPQTIPKSIAFTSKELTVESAKSIIGGLNSEVTGQTLTIPLAVIKREFETSEGANDGDTSEAWITLKNSKSNWTITLS